MTILLAIALTIAFLMVIGLISVGLSISFEYIQGKIPCIIKTVLEVTIAIIFAGLVSFWIYTLYNAFYELATYILQ